MTTSETARSKLAMQENTQIPAFFAFSIAKCGSTMLNKALEIINREVDIPETNLPGKYFREGIASNIWSNLDISDTLKDGFCHRGFRYLPNNVARSSLLKNRKSILLIRDARDAATSHYFSKLHEHPVPGGGKGDLAAQFRAARRRTADIGLESHVLERVRVIQTQWKKYMKYLPKDHSLVRVFKYEDVVFRKKEWLSEVYNFFEIYVSDDVIKKAVAAVDVFPEQENVGSRARIVIPGDHRNKLSSETVSKMNIIARDYLSHNGYI